MAISSLSKQIGENIAKYRKLSALTQAEFAEKVGMEKETISRLESGKANISLNSLDIFAQTLQIAPLDLLKRESTEATEIANSITEMLMPLSLAQRQAILRHTRESIQLLFIEKEIMDYETE